MPPVIDPFQLLGLPLAEARRRMAALGLPAPVVVASAPPRPRRPFPEADAWRVVRVDQPAPSQGPLTLVVVPPILLGSGILAGPGQPDAATDLPPQHPAE